MMSKDLLFEIGTEEIPARFLPGVIKETKALAESELESALINANRIEVFATPRRIALIAYGLPAVQSEKSVESKGPSTKIAFGEDGSLSKAALGFAKSQGVEAISLKEKDGYLYAVKKLGGKAVIELLPEMLLRIVTSLNFPKTMRWGDLDFRFVRPIHWMVALFDDQVVPLEIAGIQSGRKSRGHRFLSEGCCDITVPSEYKQIMADNFVMVDQDERKNVIKKQITQTAKNLGGNISIDEELLEEVVHLVEYPTALSGKFDEKYLLLPKEAVITPMREHQRYFPVLDDKGVLMAHFITVRNGGTQNIEVVAAGNERVLKARLEDAAFFYNEDKKHPLETHLEKLKTVVFQDGLGSMYDKVQRLRSLSKYISQVTKIPEAVDTAKLDRAALLAKADLVTGMVGEFDELQGIMGREYALLGGEDKEVALGIYEHYMPRFAGDELPDTYTGRLVGLADKIDNICSTFSRGLVPTGSQDPYALRRQAIGIINILFAAGYNMPLGKVLVKAMELLGIAEDKRAALQEQIEDFFNQRVKNILSSEGFRYDIIDAIMAVKTDDMTELFRRAEAMQKFTKDKEKLQLAVGAFTRVANISKQPLDEINVDESLFNNDAEKALYKEYKDLVAKAEDALKKGDYISILGYTAQLAQPVNNFFDNVMVMDKDEQIKNNRLSMLKQIAAFSTSVADLSKIVE